MTIKTIQQYANEKQTSPQNIRQSKKLPIIKLPVYVKYNGEEIKVGEQKFVETEK